MDGINNIQQELEHAREQQRLNIPAKRILEKIQGIPSDIEKLQRRWFWELLQNASDYNDEVEVELELHPDKLIFKHNGKPFRPIDAENLIAPDSGKDDLELRADDTIGQFGTGFISTHVLSSHITVRGLLKSEHREEYHKFEFTLDRSGFTDKEALKNAITNASLESNQSLKISNYIEGSFDTEFSYDLTKNLPGISKGQAVSPGLEYIFEVLPYTMAFMPKIKKCTINNFNTNHVNYNIRSFTPFKLGNGFHVKIDTKPNQNSENFTIQRQFVISTIKNASVIVQVQNGEIVAYPEKLTKLFCSLPMIGTEDFSIPIALNSSKFKPKPERDGIKLSYNDLVNREIITSSVIAYKNLVNSLSQCNTDGFFNIIRWSYFKGNDQEKNWFSNNVIHPLKQHLLSTQIVRTKDSRITLGQVKIPYFSSEELKKGKLNEFYAICADYMPKLIPVQGDFQHWFDNLDFNVFKDSKYELKELLKEIDEIGSIGALSKKVLNTIDWLLKLVELTLIIDENLLDQFKIIPNQFGDFVLRKDDIYYDNEIPIDLISIYDAMHENGYQTYLLDKSFEEINDLLPKEKIKDEVILCKAIDDSFSDVPEEERHNDKFQSGLQLMFKWLADCGKTESQLKELFKWFSQKKPQLFLETIPDFDRDKVLSIAQSGKLNSLSKLASSDITSDEINTLTTNVKEVVQLAKVIEEVDGGMNILLEYAKQIKQDDEDFKFKKEIGEKVERIFKEALLKYGISSQFTRLHHDGRGSHDFEITNKINRKKFYIELKSYGVGSKSPLKLAPSQAQEGLNNPNNFCLATIARPKDINLVTEEYIKSELVSKTNIGDFVRSGVENFDKFEEIKSGNNLYISLREPVRVMVEKHHIMHGGMNFDSLIKKIKTHIE